MMKLGDFFQKEDAVSILVEEKDGKIVYVFPLIILYSLPPNAKYGWRGDRVIYVSGDFRKSLVKQVSNNFPRYTKFVIPLIKEDVSEVHIEVLHRIDYGDGKVRYELKLRYPRSWEKMGIDIKRF